MGYGLRRVAYGKWTQFSVRSDRVDYERKIGAWDTPGVILGMSDTSEPWAVPP
jgi:hypothetical protein